MPRLTYDEMVGEIKKGRSVLHEGSIIQHIAALPSRASLAAGNPQAEMAAAEDIDSRMQQLQAEMRELRAPRMPIAERPAGAPNLRLDELERGSLRELLFIAADYGLLDADNLEGRKELIAAIREKAGYTPPAAAPPATPQAAAPPEATKEVVLGPKPASEGVAVRGIQLETPAVPARAPKVPATGATESGSDGETAEQGETAEPGTDLAIYTVDQLKLIAKEAGVPDYAKLSKPAELIAAITDKTQA